jgi:hypothetical protein
MLIRRGGSKTVLMDCLVQTKLFQKETFTNKHKHKMGRAEGDLNTGMKKVSSDECF